MDVVLDTWGTSLKQPALLDKISCRYTYCMCAGRQRVHQPSRAAGGDDEPGGEAGRGGDRVPHRRRGHRRGWTGKDPTGLLNLQFSFKHVMERIRHYSLECNINVTLFLVICFAHKLKSPVGKTKRSSGQGGGSLHFRTKTHFKTFRSIP